MTTTNNEEKNQVIANLTAGNKIKFQYVDRKDDRTHLPAHVTYEIKNYEGTLLEIRDLFDNRLAWKTLVKNPEVERSRFLLTVQGTDNKIKSFYDGRVINLQEVKEVPKNFLKRTLDKIMGK